jgi:multidrug efflux pump subunit AcrB
MPLVDARGAGMEGRHTVGTAVAGGMLFATFLNILFMPILYALVRTLIPGGRRETTEVAGDH